MKQGSTFVLIVNLNVDLSRINSVIFTLKNKDVTLTKENWTYNNGKFDLPFTQEESVLLVGRTRIEAQINFADGNVAKTQIKDIYIKETLATRIIDDNIATQEGEEVELVVEEGVIYTSEDYSKLANKPKINGVVLLGDVSLDTLNIASKEYVEEEIAKFDFIKIVSELPEVGLPNRIYFVPKSNTSDNDLFDEYAWVNEQWEYYGTKQIEVDLTEYVKKTDYAGVLDINGKESYEKPLVPHYLDYAVMKALTDSKNHEWSDDEKALARALLGAIGNNDYATSKEFGVAKFINSNGFAFAGGGQPYIIDSSKTEIDDRTKGNRHVLMPRNLDYAVKKALSDCKLEGEDVWTEEEKASARVTLGIVDGDEVAY